MRLILLSLLAAIFLGGCGRVDPVHEDAVSGKVEVFGAKVSSLPRAGFSDLKMRERKLFEPFEPEVEQRCSMPIYNPYKSHPMTSYQ
jgi:hypothetical protein